MLEQSTTRIKCAMVVYELERALGRFVRERASKLEQEEAAQDVLKRSKGNSAATPSPELTQAIVENSYLGEILALAHVVSKTTSDAAHVAAIEKLALVLGLFDIRNAVSHPNRPFPDCYWYRCAAIAADPAIEALDFREVSIAFQNALENRIVEPPEAWMLKKRWAVPTVLPSTFEHSVTGLYGRQKDSSRLQRELKNSRAPLIAIVARGGVGKTSLLLQVVSDFCVSAEASQFFDGVLWASFKQEKLTATGIELLSAPAGLEDLQTLLASEASEVFGGDYPTFSQMKEALGGKRILLCLDNLETLLRDSASAFEAFYDELPEQWKVVVTSRIPVDNAKNVAIDVLDPSGGLAFTRAYLNSRGAEPNEGLAEKISVGAKCNPLAIRLVVELYLAGAELAEAFQRTEQEVLAFSFSNLLDRLTSLDNDVLETVFVMEQPSRTDLCGALEIDPDSASECISKLAKMSLLIRQEQEAIETYVLGAAIRDLLRTNPRNLALRARIVSWAAKSRSLLEQTARDQQLSGVAPIELSYFPEGAPSSLISACKQIKAAVRRDDRVALTALEIELRHRLELQPSCLLHRLYAWTALELDDLITAVTHFKKACALDREDPAPMFGLALAFQAQGSWPELLSVASELIDRDWGTVAKAGPYHANRVWALYLQCLNINEDYDTALRLTDNWSANIDQLPALAVGRASSYRRMAHSRFRSSGGSAYTGTELLELGDLLSNSCRLMLKILIFAGFFKWYMPELRKVLGEVHFHVLNAARGNSFAAGDREMIGNLLKYCLSPEAQRVGINHREIERILEALYPKPTPQVERTARSRSNFNESGYVLARIKNGYRLTAPYFFAQSEDGTDFYLRQEVFETGDPEMRKVLAPGVEIALKFDPDKGEQTAFRASEAWLVE